MKFETRLYRITTYGCLTLLAVYFFLCSDMVRADYTTDDVTEVSAICAAGNEYLLGADLSTEDNEMYGKQYIWWSQFLSAWIGPGLAKTAINDIATQIDAGGATLDGMLQLGAQCIIARQDFELEVED